MAPIVQLARLVWSGSLFQNETWSCSLHFNGPVGPLVPVGGFEAPLKAWMTRATSDISTAAKLLEIKFNSIDPVTGRYALPVSNNMVSFPVVAGASTGHGPPQITMAVSTRTELSRGRGHAGRFYPPNPPELLDAATGQVNASVAAGMAASAATLIQALNAVDPQFTAVVFSKAAQSVEVITGVRVGRIYDTMRSRRTSLVEDYQSAVVNP